MIWDFRNIATRPLFVLSGLKRWIYLQCDSTISVAQIISAYIAETGHNLDEQLAVDILAIFTKEGLMFHDQALFLSLAVSTYTYSPAANIIDVMLNRLSDLGATQHETTKINLTDFAL